MGLTFKTLTLASILLHVGFLIYGAYQDRHPVVKFTDIDYLVFTDGARYISQGLSPYLRATYRYTPLLAYLVLPNITLHPLWGKVLFCVCDLVAGWFIHEILTARGMGDHRASKYAAVWMLNPFVIAISTRGNAESIVAALVLAILWALIVKKWRRIGAVVFGIGVHFKIYPIIYAVPFWLFLDSEVEFEREEAKRTKASDNVRRAAAQDRYRSASMGRRISAFFTWKRIEFGLISGGVFLTLTALMYSIYGHEFLEGTYLYHVTRKDHRHNFSPYFYHMYLSSHEPASAVINGTLISRIASILSFGPQLCLVTVVGAVLAKDVVFATFAQTFAFVMLNKVCTSQYFMWYLCFLPIILPSSRLVADQWKLGIGLLSLWVAGQALWLSQAFRLEHLGHNTFRELWAAGAIFYLINAGILACMIRAHAFEPIFAKGNVRQVFNEPDQSASGTDLITSEEPVSSASSTTSAGLSQPTPHTITYSHGGFLLEERLLGEGAIEFVVKKANSGWGVLDVVLLATCSGILIIPYLLGGALSRWQYSLPFALILVLWVLTKLFSVRQESLLIIRTLGVQIETSNRLGQTTARFIPLSNIADLIINEAITLLTVRYYLAVVAKGEDQLAVVFEVMLKPHDERRLP
ncbi:phosphatidylinositol N-acetylglucosaminyltransferase [Spizellomyces sp. 'palustris']|nr:phosphatidylinositol N-acetylglucosaminyltransferase [Spizellomyces sp. 'palustris']